MQAPMLITAEEFSFRADTLTFRQMNTAMEAADHIFLSTG